MWVPGFRLLTISQMSETDRLLAEIVRRVEPLLRAFWTASGLQGRYSDYSQEVWMRIFRERASNVPLTTLARVHAVGVALDSRRVSERVAQTIDLKSHVQRLILDLPAWERTIMEMVLRDASTGDIARQLGVSQGAVRMAKARAMARMRKSLYRDAASPEEE